MEILSKMDRKFENITDCLSLLTNRINELDAKYSTLKAQNEMEIQQLKTTLAATVRDIAERCDNMQSMPSEGLAYEIHQRQLRRKYIMLSGVPEPNVGSLLERENADREAIKSVADELGCDLNFCNVQRIGRLNTGRARLLRFKCKSEESRNHLRLANAKKLRTASQSHLKNIYVNPDRTKMERESRKVLLSEMKERRQAGENVIIRNGRVIPLPSQNGQNFQ